MGKKSRLKKERKAYDIRTFVKEKGGLLPEDLVPHKAAGNREVLVSLPDRYHEYGYDPADGWHHEAAMEVNTKTRTGHQSTLSYSPDKEAFFIFECEIDLTTFRIRNSTFTADPAEAEVKVVAFAEKWSASRFLDTMAPMFFPTWEESTRGLAAQTTESPVWLAHLADDESWEVRYEVGANQHTDPETLDRLAKDPIRFVRAAVAANPNTSMESLTALLMEEVELGVATYHPDACDDTKRVVELMNSDEQFVEEISTFSSQSRTLHEVFTGFHKRNPYAPKVTNPENSVDEIHIATDSAPVDLVPAYQALRNPSLFTALAFLASSFNWDPDKGVAEISCDDALAFLRCHVEAGGLLTDEYLEPLIQERTGANKLNSSTLLAECVLRLA